MGTEKIEWDSLVRAWVDANWALSVQRMRTMGARELEAFHAKWLRHIGQLKELTTMTVQDYDWYAGIVNNAVEGRKERLRDEAMGA